MSIPPEIEIPDDVYNPGSGYGQGLQGLQMEDARAMLMAPYQASFGNLGDILGATLEGILNAVISGIVAGAQAVGMLVSGVIDTISGAIQWVTDGIASLFGVGNSAPTFQIGSTLADAYDKQQELIGKVDDLMEDNAGFINLCMSREHNVDWTANKWLIADFDTYVTEFKNARVTDITLPDWVSADSLYNRQKQTGSQVGLAGGGGIVFDAPGVWVINGQVTFMPNVTNFRYFEVDLRVYKVIERTDGLGHYCDSLYTETRFATGAHSQYIASAPVHKPVIIPDDGNIYAAMILVRNQVGRQWKLWGGAQWSSLSAVRESVDTTNYGASDAPIGIVSVTE